MFKADVPGLKKEGVKVEVENDNIIQISGERNKEQKEKTDTWHRVERSSGKFLHRFRPRVLSVGSFGLPYIHLFYLGYFATS